MTAAAASSVVTRRLSGHHDLLALAGTFPERYPALHESVAHGTSVARWDLLPAFPQEQLCLHSDGQLTRDGRVCADNDFLATLDRDFRAERVQSPDDELPFHGGWALFLAYELAGYIEPRLQLPAAEDGAPIAVALRCPAAVIHDHEQGTTTLVAEAEHAALLAQMEADLHQTRAVATGMPAITTLDEEPAERYTNAVVAAQDHLQQGDIFQANLSRGWRAEFAREPSPAALYGALRRANPAPFAALWQQPGWSVVSSSPERLVSVRGTRVDTRPIAGTRPRREQGTDAASIRELTAHPKERAEHIMLVDLERNDMGRIARPGSVSVDELMVTESYAHVHHLVSNVCGQLRAEVTPGEVIAATFPGGSITGCPKVRCMEIIAELEGTGRGAYTGAIGYLDRCGDMDLNILIRSMSVTGATARFRAGGGIVVDSVPASELAETRAKARGLVCALDIPDELAPAHQRTA